MTLVTDLIRPKLTTAVAAGAILLSMTIAAFSTGCAPAESRNWAQTSPVLEPESRKKEPIPFHLGARGEHRMLDEDWPTNVSEPANEGSMSHVTDSGQN